MAAKAEEQHLDADVEVLAHKTWRVEGASPRTDAADAADAAPEQMNILLDARKQSMNNLVHEQDGGARENWKKSLRPLCVVEDLNDDGVMELCILSMT